MNTEKEKKTIRLLNKFCHKQKEQMIHPFTEGKYTYASDGVIIIRVKKINSITAKLSLAGLKELKWPHNKTKEENWESLPNPGYIQKCQHCNGSGKDEKCMECKGSGVIELHTDFNEYEVDCMSCDGIGKPINKNTPCRFCDGSKVNKSVTLKFHRKHVAVWIIDKISKLDNPKLSNFGEKAAPIPFIFEGGEGLFMPSYKRN